MLKVDPSMLQPGVRLAMGLYTRQGVKLLNPGVVLTRDICTALTHSKWGSLFFATSALDLSEGEILHPVEQGHAGEFADADIVTTGGVLAVEAGDLIEPHHADAYALGAYQGPATREDRRLRAQRMKIADQRVAELVSQWSRLPRTISPDPIAADQRAADDKPTPWPSTERIVHLRKERCHKFRGVFARILSGARTDIGELLYFVDEMVRMCSANPERFPQLALLSRLDYDRLPDHCYSTACLSVAIATRMKWSVDHVRLAGLAGLVSDVGMGLVPQDLRNNARALNEIEINRVRRHPAFSVLLLESVEGLPEEIRMAAHQHHERENGSGYPSGLKSKAICDLARIVAVADTFVAATAARRFRPTRRSYDALEETIMLASSQVFDRKVVRALVETVGLFPIGGYVQLSNGAAALVVGSRPDPIDRPIVVVRSGAEKDRVQHLTIDLADFKPWELHVIQAIDTPAGSGLEPMTARAG